MNSNLNSPVTQNESPNLLSGNHPNETLPCVPTQGTPASPVCRPRKVKLVLLKLVSKCLKAKHRLRKLCGRNGLKARTPEKVEPQTNGGNGKTEGLAGHKHPRKLFRSRFLRALAKHASSGSGQVPAVEVPLQTPGIDATPDDMAANDAADAPAGPMQDAQHVNAAVSEPPCLTVGFPSQYWDNMRLMEFCVKQGSLRSSQSETPAESLSDVDAEEDLVVLHAETRMLAWTPNAPESEVTEELPTPTVTAPVSAVRCGRTEASMAASSHPEKVAPAVRLVQHVTPILALTLGLTLNSMFTVAESETETPIDDTNSPVKAARVDNGRTFTRKPWYDYDSDDGFSEFSWLQTPETLPVAAVALDSAPVLQADADAEVQPTHVGEGGCVTQLVPHKSRGETVKRRRRKQQQKEKKKSQRKLRAAQS